MGWPRPLTALLTRRTRLAGLWLAALASVVVAGYLLLPLAVQALIAAIDLTLGVGVWIAGMAGSGADPSTIALAVGRELLQTVTSTKALVLGASLVLLSAAALLGLQRVLGLDDDIQVPARDVVQREDT